MQRRVGSIRSAYTDFILRWILRLGARIQLPGYGVNQVIWHLLTWGPWRVDRVLPELAPHVRLLPALAHLDEKDRFRLVQGVVELMVRGEMSGFLAICGGRHQDHQAARVECMVDRLLNIRPRKLVRYEDAQLWFSRDRLESKLQRLRFRKRLAETKRDERVVLRLLGRVALGASSQPHAVRRVGTARV